MRSVGELSPGGGYGENLAQILSAGNACGNRPRRLSVARRIFKDSCRRFADRPAYHNLGVTLTFRELEHLSREFAAYLAGSGW